MVASFVGILIVFVLVSCVLVCLYIVLCFAVVLFVFKGVSFGFVLYLKFVVLLIVLLDCDSFCFVMNFISCWLFCIVKVVCLNLWMFLRFACFVALRRLVVFVCVCDLCFVDLCRLYLGFG